MKQWFYSLNQILNTTEGSYRSMRKISNYTVNALEVKKDDEFFNGLYTLLFPFNAAYNTAYSTWISYSGVQKGKTLSLANVLTMVRSEKIEEWDITIQGSYKRDSPRYVELLPHYRTPFQTGSQEDIMSAVEALNLAIGDDTKLVELKTEVVALEVLLKTTLNEQKKSKSTTGSSSEAVETARINVGVELYGVLGLLMNHYKKTPNEVANFFDLQTIRNHEQSIFKQSIGGGETVLAVTHHFDVDEMTKIVNRGQTTLRFALVKNSRDAIGDIFVELGSNSTLIVDSKDFGDTTDCRYLKVQNMNPLAEGAYTIQLL